MDKATKGLSWKSAEVLQSPESLKRKDWDKVSIEVSDEEEQSEQNVEKYFKDLFANAPEDAKKAMIKSFVSTPTILTYCTVDWIWRNRSEH